MRSTAEAYIGIWVVMILLMLCVAFTSIHLNVKTANKLYDDIKAQVQASNGAILKGGVFNTNSNSGGRDTGLKSEGFYYTCKVECIELSNKDADVNNTFIYNDVYKITLDYEYSVPIFGTIKYPIIGYSN